MQAAAEWPWARQMGTPLCVGVPAEVAFGGDSEQRAVMAQRARGVAPYRAASFPPGQAPPTPQVRTASRHPSWLPACREMHSSGPSHPRLIATAV